MYIHIHLCLGKLSVVCIWLNSSNLCNSKNISLLYTSCLILVFIIGQRAKAVSRSKEGNKGSGFFWQSQEHRRQT